MTVRSKLGPIAESAFENDLSFDPNVDLSYSRDYLDSRDELQARIKEQVKKVRK